MRNLARNLVLGGALLASAGMAHAQTTTLLDSLTTGTATPSGNENALIGYDAGSTLTTQTQSQVGNINTNAGYVVVPFTLSGSTAYTISNVSFRGDLISAADPNFNPATNLNLYGAFVKAPTGAASLSPGATVIGGGFFQFTVPGNYGNQTFSATVSGTPAPVTLGAGSYYLVLAPEAKIGVSPSDTALLEVGAAKVDTVAQLHGATLNNGITSEGTSLWEANGANTPDTLSTALANNNTPGYVPVQILGTAVSAVPEGSTVLTALIGLAPIGGLLLRRRSR